MNRTKERTDMSPRNESHGMLWITIGTGGLLALEIFLLQLAF